MSCVNVTETTSLWKKNAMSRHSQKAKSDDKLHRVNLTFVASTCDAHILQALTTASFPLHSYQRNGFTEFTDTYQRHTLACHIRHHLLLYSKGMDLRVLSGRAL